MKFLKLILDFFYCVQNEDIHFKKAEDDFIFLLKLPLKTQNQNHIEFCLILIKFFNIMQMKSYYKLIFLKIPLRLFQEGFFGSSKI